MLYYINYYWSILIFELTLLFVASICETTLDKSSKSKLILLWTPIYATQKLQMWSYYGIKLYPSMLNSYCSYKCEFTQERSQLNDSDAIVYFGHFGPTDKSIHPFPDYEQRKANNYSQVWLFLMNEPPNLNNQLLEQVGINHEFNWTMTYRSDSDIVLQYGEFIKLPNVESNKKSRLLKSIEKKSVRNDGAVVVASMISNCVSPFENFLEYFSWRNEFKVSLKSNGNRAWCELCTKLHNLDSQPRQSYGSIPDWFNRNNTIGDNNICLTNQTVNHGVKKPRFRGITLFAG